MNTDSMSIFGETNEGILNPRVFHEHPYPTRYHGPIWSYPRFGMPYVGTPYTKDPYAGFGDVFGSPTGSWMYDAGIGGGLGYIVADPGKQKMWAIAGAAAGGLLGTVGILGVVAAGLYTASKK